MNFITATLKALALRGASNRYVPVSTRGLGRGLGVSQQTASNRLIAMEASGLISRRRGVHGQDVMISKDGMELLRREFADYQRIFTEPGAIKLSGTVASGLGEGQYYLNKPGYHTQILEKLGFTPFNGTLNIRVSESEMAKLSIVPPESRIRIDSFRADGRTYGEAECIPVKINDISCAIIMPKRSHHTGVLEIISANHLRQELCLKDGDTISVILERRF
ncbi:MAG: DUF120 domain-containing protein [Candidatus Thermoplasmatota archaeon]|nr:DUF120 domain-containing protein [Euryarchaeota archaeon]MBU4032617.1 DUF120 domain-containing protein [Candidatus Thermoplasmatota archaeon]MBU4072171.1 DUF120 domain-containing protein [Candidatus Thermoplasmatota archaeon]MBU4145027.1 DUF120 domain-containing protein [Candidatus Thermoplasmatota archaeon]MBU4592041.1 DUF120 domain-containing protein [Candidatus Thermoplasmatota archaeon]